MKRGTLEHPKLFALKRELDRPLPHVVGILEMLWHFTARYAPTGDLSRFSDDEIAVAVHWSAGGRRLVDGLVAAGWLASAGDRPASVAGRRLFVHDWQDHADDAVKKALQRKGLAFACPDTVRLPIPIPSLPDPDPEPEPLLSPKKKKPLSRLREADALQASVFGFVEFWSQYQPKKGKGAALRAWQKQGCAAFAPKVMATLERMQREDAQWQSGYIPHAATWLNAGGWDDEPAPAPKPQHRQTAADRQMQVIRRTDELFERLIRGEGDGPVGSQEAHEQPGRAVSPHLGGGAGRLVHH
jgi:hypothetical protein